MLLWNSPLGYVLHSDHIMKDQGPQSINHSWEPSMTTEDKIMGDGVMEIVTLECLMLDYDKQDDVHFDIEEIITKHGLVFCRM